MRQLKALREIKDGVAWKRRDSGFLIRDITGIRATLKGGEITIEKTAGRPSELEVFYDDRIMPIEVLIKGFGKECRWKPRPTIRTMLERVRATGEREQLYGDSTILKNPIP